MCYISICDTLYMYPNVNKLFCIDIYLWFVYKNMIWSVKKFICDSFSIASTQMKKAMTIAHFPDILVLQICKLEEVW